MKFTISTKIDFPYERIYPAFTKELLLAVAMPYPKLKLIKFEGPKPGDMVEAELDLFFFNALWVSKVTGENIGDNETWFIDEGEKMPFGIKVWKHCHKIIRQERGAIIVDEVTFKTGNVAGDLMLYCMFFPAFYYRKHRYRKYFNSMKIPS